MCSQNADTAPLNISKSSDAVPPRAWVLHSSTSLILIAPLRALGRLLPAHVHWYYLTTLRQMSSAAVLHLSLLPFRYMIPTYIDYLYRAGRCEFGTVELQHRERCHDRSANTSIGGKIPSELMHEKVKKCLTQHSRAQSRIAAMTDR